MADQTITTPYVVHNTNPATTTIFGQQVPPGGWATSSIGGAFGQEFGAGINYFTGVFTYLVPFLLGLALLFWLWRIITGFLHRR